MSSAYEQFRSAMYEYSENRDRDSLIELLQLLYSNKQAITENNDGYSEVLSDYIDEHLINNDLPDTGELFLHHCWDMIDIVVEHSGLDLQSIMDASHGSDGGFSGFIYNSDMIEFFDNNKLFILEYLKQTRNELYTDLDIDWQDVQELCEREPSNEELREAILAMMMTWGRADMLESEYGYKILASWAILEEASRQLDYFIDELL